MKTARKRRDLTWGRRGLPLVRWSCLLLSAVLANGPLCSYAEELGPSGPLAQKGIRHAEAGRYRQAINALEDAWDLDPTDPAVAQHLALSYLYERHPPSADALKKAENLMRFALENKGQAAVRASHLHRGVQWATTVDGACPGRVLLKEDGVHFLASADPHSFFIPKDRLAVASLPKDRPKHAGILILETLAGKRYRLRTGTHTREEAQLLVKLIRSLIVGG